MKMSVRIYNVLNEINGEFFRLLAQMVLYTQGSENKSSGWTVFFRVLAVGFNRHETDIIQTFE